MKNTTLLLFLSLISFYSFSQVVETKIYAIKRVKWDEDDQTFYQTPQDQLSDSSKSFITLSYDKITVSMANTNNFYLNEAPTEREDSLSVERIWFRVVNDSSSRFFVHLFYYKNDNSYMLRVVNQSTDKGVDFYSHPMIKEGDLPKKKKR